MNRAIAVFVVMIGTTVLAPLSTATAVSGNCADYVIFGARGTDQSGNDNTAGFGPESRRAAQKLRGIFKEAGKTVDLVGVDYPVQAPTRIAQALQRLGDDRSVPQSAYVAM
ncbi:MAG: Cutinase [Actinomycetota bacterium]